MLCVRLRARVYSILMHACVCGADHIRHPIIRAGCWTPVKSHHSVDAPTPPGGVCVCLGGGVYTRVYLVCVNKMLSIYIDTHHVCHKRVRVDLCLNRSHVCVKCVRARVCEVKVVY